MILINGIKMIAKAGFSERNILVMGLTFVFGIGVPAHPEAVAQLPGFIRFIFNDAVTATCSTIFCPGYNPSERFITTFR
jgi:NCS2 family nucleobase:cation symporter-2